MCVCVCVCVCKYIYILTTLNDDRIIVEPSRRGGLVVRVSAFHTVGHWYASRPGHTKDHHKNGTNC